MGDDGLSDQGCAGVMLTRTRNCGFWVPVTVVAYAPAAGTAARHDHAHSRAEVLAQARAGV